MRVVLKIMRSYGSTCDILPIYIRLHTTRFITHQSKTMDTSFHGEVVPDTSSLEFKDLTLDEMKKELYNKICDEENFEFPYKLMINDIDYTESISSKIDSYIDRLAKSMGIEIDNVSSNLSCIHDNFEHIHSDGACSGNNCEITEFVTKLYDSLNQYDFFFQYLGFQDIHNNSDGSEIRFKWYRDFTQKMEKLNTKPEKLEYINNSIKRVNRVMFIGSFNVKYCVFTKTNSKTKRVLGMYKSMIKELVRERKMI